MECRKCGNENDQSARFCSACGSSIGAKDATTAAIALVDDKDSIVKEYEETVAKLAPDAALLVARRGPNAGSSFLLTQDQTTLGRTPEADIFLDDITVSREHAVIAREGGVYLVRDHDSLNGTYLNHEVVNEGVLDDLSELQIGRYIFTFMRGRET